MTCVYKRLSTFCSFFLSKQCYLFSFGFPRHPLLSFLKVLLTWLPQIEKSITLCQNYGQFQYECTGNFGIIAWILRQLQWRALKITFFLNVKESTSWNSTKSLLNHYKSCQIFNLRIFKYYTATFLKDYLHQNLSIRQGWFSPFVFVSLDAGHQQLSGAN